MKRRLFLLGSAGLALTARCGAYAAEASRWTTLAGRPGGGLPILMLRPPNAGSGPCPVIIYSHGLSARAEKFTRLVAPWVDAGFLLLLPQHMDSFARNAPRHPTFAQLTRYALLRIEDIHAMLDALPSLAKEAEANIVPGAVGLGGSSFGAWTAAVISGARVVAKPGGQLESFADPRPRALLMLAAPPVPPSADVQHPFDGLTRSSFGDLTRPLLLIDGTSDGVPPRGPESYRERLATYELSPPGNKYLGVERDATHITLSGFGPASQPGQVAIAARTLQHIHALSLPFWRGFVGGDESSIAWLNGPAPAAIDPANLTFSRRPG